MSNPTFAECFCEKHAIPREKFARAVLSRALYWRALPVRWILSTMNPNYFAADFDLIYGVENLRRLRDFKTEVARFNEHPANRGLLRRTFCFRVSTCRLKELIRETLPAKTREHVRDAVDEPGSAVPFELKTEFKSPRTV